jgi:hypothetical protein
MSVGRPRVLDDAKRREICALLSAGCGIREAARYVGCAPSTIHREAERNDDFNDRLRRATMYAELSPLQAMRQAVSTHWRAAAWMLERTRPERFARRDPKAFTPKQARALANDLLDIVGSENLDPFKQQRLEKRIESTIQCALWDACGDQRTRRDLRRAISFFASLDDASDPLVQFGMQKPDIDKLKAAHVQEEQRRARNRQRPGPDRSPNRAKNGFVDASRNLSAHFRQAASDSQADPAPARDSQPQPHTPQPTADGAQNP